MRQARLAVALCALSLSVAGLTEVKAQDATPMQVRPVMRVRPVTTTPAVAPAAAPVTRAAMKPAAPAYDPLAWINAARAQRGLYALIYDPSLSTWADNNNAAESRRGMGHHILAPGAAQITASTADPGYAVRLWTNSPGHARIMFSNSYRYAGISHLYGFATANMR